jgi:hypothetical protein
MPLISRFFVISNLLYYKFLRHYRIVWSLYINSTILLKSTGKSGTSQSKISTLFHAEGRHIVSINLRLLGLGGLFAFLMGIISGKKKKKETEDSGYTPTSSGRDSITYTPSHTDTGSNGNGGNGTSGSDREPGTRDWVEDGSG